VVDAAAADELDDDPPAADALDDDDDDPHPPSAAAIMATTTVPAPMCARLDLSMVRLLLSTLPACRPAWNLRRLGEANRLHHLAASPRR